MVLSSANCAVPGLILSVRIDYDPLIRLLVGEHFINGLLILVSWLRRWWLVRTFATLLGHVIG